MTSFSSSPLIRSIIRVNQAGELGAKCIYEGQLSQKIGKEEKKIIERMYIQEKNHLSLFNELALKYNVRPTLLTPIWKKLGFSLGAFSAFCGKNAIMACTAIIEEVIEKHYNEQLHKLRSIGENYALELQDLIAKCQKDEIQHKETALKHQAEEMRGYFIFKHTLKIGIQLAIALSKRI